MLSFREMVLIQMKKNKITRIKELEDRMNDSVEVKEGRDKVYTNTVIRDVLEGRSTNIRYIYRMEKVFNLPRGFLSNMVDLKGIYKKAIEKEE